ncbi:MAG: glutamine synthetase III, partial [Clostridia bacterium]|nr:glutamine synthetase III [Clostridia bacterium]
DIKEIFGSFVFDDETMKARLPEDIYHTLKTSIDERKSIDSSIADTVANAMKDWAIEKGATHFTHWFQPMTDITAEKHDSFISVGKDGKALLEFSGKELIKGEPDASSFPSGGLRATFEARGYTAWDPSSYAFVKDGTLCIPTAFCSYEGEALDQKTPLLRSMDAINRQALRIVNLFGINDVKRINTMVGPEQEYFLVDKELFDKRPDLVFCGRTLLGAKPPKGQEMEDHYFGVIRPRVAAFMRDLDKKLWELGVMAKTEHNEAAPAQYELAPVFSNTNIAADHNQLTMELMKKTAEEHGLVCILHEKPFAGVNGSGKHNNWSICTDTGINLLKPGKNASSNNLFLLTLSAVIKAVDEHQDLLRIAIASAGNDMRLGAAEAPPAIISIYLGDELDSLLESIQKGEHHNDVHKTNMTIGTDIIPFIRKDNTDRNRTSPFAFTGNKFEFRMLGSSASISDTNVIINTIVAEAFREFADKLEKSSDFENDVKALIKETIQSHKRIIFNGDGYSDEWKEEAKRRGLLCIENTAEALPLLSSRENINLFEAHGVFSETELKCREEIRLDNYCKTIHIEALTLLQMTKRDVIPAISNYTDVLCECMLKKQKLGDDINCFVESELVRRLSDENAKLFKLSDSLKSEIENAKKIANKADTALFYHDKILALMNEIRDIADTAETETKREYWPYPTYDKLLFKI